MKEPREIFRKLIKSRESLGLPEGEYDFQKNHVLEKLEGDGVEIASDKLKNYFDPERKRFVYKGNVVVVYISDTKKSEEYLIDESLIRRGIEKSPKFHFNWCGTLQNMEYNGRYDDRYVLAISRDGFFTVQAGIFDAYQLDKRVKLYVCRNCLRTDYKGFKNLSKKEQTNAVKNFDLEHFLEQEEERYAH